MYFRLLLSLPCLALISGGGDVVAAAEALLSGGGGVVAAAEELLPGVRVQRANNQVVVRFGMNTGTLLAPRMPTV